MIPSNVTVKCADLCTNIESNVHLIHAYVSVSLLALLCDVTLSVRLPCIVRCSLGLHLHDCLHHPNATYFYNCFGTQDGFFGGYSDQRYHR